MSRFWITLLWMINRRRINRRRRRCRNDWRGLGRRHCRERCWFWRFPGCWTRGRHWCWTWSWFGSGARCRIRSWPLGWIGESWVLGWVRRRVCRRVGCRRGWWWSNRRFLRRWMGGSVVRSGHFRNGSWLRFFLFWASAISSREKVSRVFLRLFCWERNHCRRWCHRRRSDTKESSIQNDQIAVDVSVSVIVLRSLTGSDKVVVQASHRRYRA